MIFRAFLLSFLWLVMVGCERAPGSVSRSAPIFHEKAPLLLSDWHFFTINKNKLNLSEQVIPYSLSTPLFTDYAHKMRTIWIPEGSASYQHDDILDFPVGTVISKTFYYPTHSSSTKGASNKSSIPVVKKTSTQFLEQKTGLSLDQHLLLETRLLIHRTTGWEPVSYVWNEQQTDATLKRIGAIKKLLLKEDNGNEQSFSYIVPNINQCSGCHAPNNTTRTIVPIGPKGRNLDIINPYQEGTENQLAYLARSGFLKEHTSSKPGLSAWDAPGASLDHRARAYLDVNCAHCHNPVGPADTSGLHLNIENSSAPHLGICKLAVAAGAGTGGRAYDIDPGNPYNSIFVYRIETDNPAAMMPELGRSLTHTEGAQLIREWIEKMDDSCQDS